jgi:SAM-dependent methyltransferase
MRPLIDSRWNAPGTVAGFERGLPNDTLMRFASQELARVPNGCAVDIGAGAGRNSVPLAEQGWDVLAIDLSAPMLAAAARRVAAAPPHARVRLTLAPMDALPVRTASADLVIAHGIWNLARSTEEFRQAVREAARVCRPGGGLFVFTFSRHTLPDWATAVPDEPFVFTQFSGQPQCFLTDAELIGEMARAGFRLDPAVPLSEHNRPPGGIACAGGPVIYEAAFRRV